MTKRTSDLVLYRFFDANGALLYVGKSVRAWGRFSEHRRGSGFYPEAARVTLQRGFASDKALAQAELAAIRSECPRFNVAHNPKATAPNCEAWPTLAEVCEVARQLDPDAVREVTSVAAGMSEYYAGRRADLDASICAMNAELQRERRAASMAARRARGQHVGRPKALSKAQRDQVLMLHAGGTAVVDIARSFRVGRDTVYRVIRSAAEEDGSDGE